MALTVLRFRVYLAATPDTTPEDATGHDVLVLPADRMRAERESPALLPPSQRGPGAHKVHAETWLALWLWCAATRSGAFTGTHEEFTAALVDYDRLNRDGTVADDDDPGEAVPPTRTAMDTGSP